MLVLGTAGHVDHGKSTLVQALTGIDPDRLVEEKRRGLTIDLGFAWMASQDDLKSGHIGLIDVPGHLDFIRNMLAGVSGIDAAMLVVAADEGVMPQTREHLAILDLLDIEVCVPILTKIDAAPDQEWLALVELEFAELLEGTKFARSPIWQVSAERGTGLEELKAHLRSLPADRRQTMRDGPARLPIDRVFTLSGFGTVVTGTLCSGQLNEGDIVEVLPGRIEGRVRSLQAYHQDVKEASAGTRLAVNLGGVSHHQIRRGQVLSQKGNLQESETLDAVFRLLPDAPKPVVHDMTVMLFHGSTEVTARVRLLRDSMILPGEEGFCQLVTTRPMVIARDDRFIIRMPSPSITLGGGIVLAAPSKRYWKRFDDETESYFSDMSSQDLPTQLTQIVTASPFQTFASLLKEFPMENPSELRNALSSCLRKGILLEVPFSSHETYASTEDESHWLGMAISELESYHDQYPLRQGQPREDLLSRLALQMRRKHKKEFEPSYLAALLNYWTSKSLLQVEKGIVSLDGHVVRFSEKQEQAAAKLASTMEANPFNPPTKSVMLEQLDNDKALLEVLLEEDSYITVSNDIVFSESAFAAMQDRIMQYLSTHGTATLAELRDLLGTSRKYVQPLLEYMDASLITRREGETRTLTERKKKELQRDL